MKKKYNRICRAVACGVAGIALGGGWTGALAQATEESGGQTIALEEIVVTGTLIRGIAPVGSNSISLSREDIEASAAIDTNQLLGTLVPQSNFFMDIVEPARGLGEGLTRVPITRPNLRGISEALTTASSGAPTLVLFNGQRLVPAGIEQSVVDLGIIPSGILSSLETIFDGASSLYGSDAVAGVINLIPRTRFDSTDISVMYGYADNHDSVAANVTTGTSWDTGGIGFTFAHNKSTKILNRDRSHAAPRNYLDGGRLTGLACEDHGHVTVGSAAQGSLQRFTTPDFVEGADWCQSNAGGTLSPATESNSGLVNFSQDVTDRIKFDTTAFYTKRGTTQIFGNGSFDTSGLIGANNPYRQVIPGVPAAVPQTVSFDYSPVFGGSFQSGKTVLETWQVMPSLTFELSSDWQLKTSFSYGESISRVEQNALNTLAQIMALNGNSLANAINPYDIGATQNRDLFENMFYLNVREGRHDFTQLRAVADGSVFSLPGGDVKAAVGAEWSETNFKRRDTNAQTRLLGKFEGASQESKSLFGEIVVPIVGPDNRRPGIESLSLSFSGRWDDYKNFGDTFNPKVAFTYEPVQWATVRGNWGTSFRAPNAVDQLAASANVIRCIGAAAGCISAVPGLPGVEFPPGDNVMLYLTGTVEDIQPEESTNWSIGGEIRPQFLPGLTISADYYDIDFTDFIGMPVSGPTGFADAYLHANELFVMSPTDAEADEFVARAPNSGVDALQLIRSAGHNLVYAFDGRTTNLSAARLKGVDFHVRYIRETSFGSWDASFNGSRALTIDFARLPNAPVSDLLRYNESKFRATANVGVNVGNLRAQASLQHRQGFKVEESSTRDPGQRRIGDFNIVNLSFRYDLHGGHDLLRDMSIMLNVNNVFDRAPPRNRTDAGTTMNGNTIGRFIQVGLNKRF